MSGAGLIIAAPSSGSGKTVLTLALLRALRRQGLRVGSFKVGPDYLDPVYHARASGRPCHNLDPWAMRFGTLAALADEAAEGVDLVIGEGVMGLFDGARDGTGSTADLAAMFDLPVLLVVDAGGMGASAAAIVQGFARHREDIDVAGVLFNRVGSAAHEVLLRRACDDHTSIPVVGCIPRDERLALPARHLGLVQADEHPGLERFLDSAADHVARHVDFLRLQRIARRSGVTLLGPKAAPLPPLGQRIAVARDAAFAFAYPATLAGWQRRGAELLPFSPLADEAADAGADAVYLPGGYPELHAGKLANNRRFLGSLSRAAAREAAIYGECGGYMVLGEALIDANGDAHRMAGLLPASTSFASPKLHLGYRRIELTAGHRLGDAGSRFRGHEFHYASELERSGEPLFRLRCAEDRDRGEAGCRRGSVAGSFVHLIDRAEHRHHDQSPDLRPVRSPRPA